MIGDWLAQTPVLLVATLVVFLPGAAALYLVGLRGLALLATAPLFTVASTAIIAIGLGAVGLPWSVLSWLLASLLTVGLAAGARGLLGGRLRQPGPRPRSWLIPSAMAIGVAIGLWRLASYITEPDGISQTNDAVFHMNAVRYVLETADASSLHVNGVIGGSSFYPAAWHGIVSLIVMITGTSIPIAANALTLVIGALIWPFGLTWLTHVVTRSAPAAAAAGLLSSSLQTFPLLMFQWGVLFPNALSVAMIPAAVGIVVSLPSWQSSRGHWQRNTHALLLVLVTACALSLSQPAALLPWLAVVLVWFTSRLFLTGVLSSATRRWSVIVGLWLLLGVFWVVLSRGTSGSHWPAFRSMLEAGVDVLFNGQLGIPSAIGVSLLMLWGAVVAWRARELRWLVFTWLGLSGLYVMVASVDIELVRVNLLGAWYADPYRVAALAPLAVIPLAAIGFDDLATRGLALLARRRAAMRFDDAATRLLRVAFLSMIMIALVVLRPVAMPAFLQGTFDRESRYISASDSYLSPDERALLERLPEYVEPGQRVLGNPSTGSGFGYMLSGVDVYPRTWSSPDNAAWAALGQRLRDAAEDPSVCQALQVYGDPRYVLDFGIGEASPGRFELPGMTDFEGQAGFEKVAAIGDASLWRITACAR